MSTLTEIEKAIEMLPAEEREILFAKLAAQLGHTMATSTVKVRRAGLHGGAWKEEVDFDAALPDEFWVEREA